MFALGVAITAVAFSVYLFSRPVSGRNSGSPTSVEAAPTPTPALVSVSKPLVEGELSIRNRQDIRYKLEIDTTKMLSPVVSGSFRANGGTGNDIRVILADEYNFENWTNGHSAETLYDSDKTTIGKLDVPITQSGTYYLVFSNRFSALTPKQVFANVTLTYQTQASAKADQ